MHDSVSVFNLSDQVCRAVTRKLRAERVRCHIIAGTSQLEDILNDKPAGIILAGDCAGDREILFDSRILQSGVPILALGGASLFLIRLLGGSSESREMESGLCEVKFADNALTCGIDDQERMMSGIVPLADTSGIMPLCTCDGSMIGYTHELMPVYGIQLPVEQNDPDSSVLLKNFAVNICGCANDWDDEKVIMNAQNEICALAENGNAVCAVTGGLSTAVSAVMAYRVLGSRLKCFFVETGLLRRDEGASFTNDVIRKMGLDVTVIDKSEEILAALENITDRDEKRRLIRKCREDALDYQIANTENVTLLIRGTNMSDIMQGDLPVVPGSSSVGYNICEPLHELFRDEVRHIAEMLGMPGEFVSQQSFPGTGLALRITGTVTGEKLEILRTCDEILIDEIEEAGIKRLFKCFASIASDTCKAEKYIINLRAVVSGDGDTAMPARLPYDVLERVVGRILKTCSKVCRVMYDLTPASDYSEIEFR